MLSLLLGHVACWNLSWQSLLQYSYLFITGLQSAGAVRFTALSYDIHSYDFGTSDCSGSSFYSSSTMGLWTVVAVQFYCLELSLIIFIFIDYETRVTRFNDNSSRWMGIL